MGHRTVTDVFCNPIHPFTPDDIAQLETADNIRLAHALVYLHMGFSPIPLCGPTCKGKGDGHDHPPHRSGKAPLLKAWQKYAAVPPTEQTVKNWWKRWPDANVGVALGGQAGVIGIDVDDEYGAELLAEVLGGSVPQTLAFRTGGGGTRHLFRWPKGERVPTGHTATDGHPLSSLGHGAQTVMPPSRHRCGDGYEWVGEWHRGLEAVALVPDRLRAFLNGRTPSKRPTVGGAGRALLAGMFSERAERRAVAYLAACPPAVEGQGGDNQTLRVCSGLLDTIGLTTDEALRIMLAHYNPRCEPPWEEAELRRKLVYAEGRGPRLATGGLTVEPNDGNPAVGPESSPMDPCPVMDCADELARPCSVGVAIPVTPPAASTSSATTGPTPAGNATATSSTATSSTATRSKPATAGPVVAGRIQAAGPAPLPGRLASALVERPVEWFLAPYFARGMLSLVAGRPGTGKSTLAAHLMGKAKRVVLLPGREEDAERMLLPRLRASGVALGNVLLLEDGDWQLPHSEDRLVDVATRFAADLVLADPIGSYMADGTSENDGQAVRAFLESLAAVAKRTGAAVIGIRHPGKDPANVMVGSREWLSVPRSVVELLADSGPPKRCIIRPFKDSLGQDSPPRHFELIRVDNAPPAFHFGDLVDDEAVELAQFATEPGERSAIARALELIPRLLADGPMEAKAVYAAAESERLHHKVVDRAATRLRISRDREGSGKNHRCLWSFPSGGG